AVDLSAARVILKPLDVVANSQVDSVLKTDGTFQLDAVSRDRFLLNLTGTDEVYIRSVRLGTEDVTETGIDLSGAASAATLEITLGVTPGSVTGTVKDGDKPGPGRAVTMLPDPPRPMQPYLIYTIYADADGGFQLTGVASGSYRLYAWEEIT